ncbi:MAG: DUF305 domain-containing protein [Actinomycetota bacterium]|nr:DUF305 domain-containing protein [Actinomycetota bacterium]
MLEKFPHTFLPALMLVVAMLVAGCGDSDSSGDGGPASSANSIDRAFVAEMIPHHESAVEMAKIAQRRGSSEFVMQLADDIVRTQNAEISTMRAADRRLRSAGVAKGSLGVPEHMTGMDADTSTLRTAKPFDRAFIRMMLPHHEGAIPMAKAEIAKGGDAALKKLAQEIITAQQREISMMRKQLGEAGAAGTDDADATHGTGHSG